MLTLRFPQLKCFSNSADFQSLRQFLTFYSHQKTSMEVSEKEKKSSLLEEKKKKKNWKKEVWWWVGLVFFKKKLLFNIFRPKYFQFEKNVTRLAYSYSFLSKPVSLKLSHFLPWVNRKFSWFSLPVSLCSNFIYLPFPLYETIAKTISKRDLKKIRKTLPLK